MSILQEAVHVISDPAHVLAEVFFITVEAVILTPIIKWGIKRHDRRSHNHGNHGVSGQIYEQVAEGAYSSPADGSGNEPGATELVQGRDSSKTGGYYL